jgi:pantothenate kinase
MLNTIEMQNIDRQVDRILVALGENPNAYLVALVGIPGSGKSTLCDRLAKRLPNSIILPMDGYHLYRCQLTQAAMKRRGSPHTFDAVKLREDIERLRQNHCGSFPAFDHAVKDPEPDAIHIDADCSIVIIEGNYLLLKEWNLEHLFDVTIFLDCDLHEAMSRVQQRHLRSGIVATKEEAAERVKENDLLNARLILDDGAMERAQLIVQP